LERPWAKPAFAKFLWQTARQVVRGALTAIFPPHREAAYQNYRALAANTAGPGYPGLCLQFSASFFIETNIRTVYIHHFFHDRPSVSDKASWKLV